MSQLRTLKRDQFTMKKVKFNNPGLTAVFTEKRDIEGNIETIQTSKTAKYNPHPDLVAHKNSLKHYLAKCYGFHIGFDIAEKYLKGEQKQKAIDAKIEHYDKIQVTGVSISGEEDLVGAVISGKIESNNGSMIAMNTPRIVFSSDKIGYEKEVQKICELIEIETYKYLFNGKSSQQSLNFNESEDADDIEVKDPKEVDANAA